MTIKDLDGCNLPSLAEIVAEHKNLEMLAWMLDRVLGPVHKRNPFADFEIDTPEKKDEQE